MSSSILFLALALFGTADGFEQQKLLASDGQAGAWFGVDVAVDADTLVVGTVINRFYVFERAGATWSQTARIAGTQPADQLGRSVAAGTDRIAAGNFGWDIGGVQGAGCVETYVRSGADWTFEQRLEPLDPQSGGFMGIALALDGGTLLAGASGDDTGAQDSGAAYVFAHDGSSWTQQAKLVAQDPEALSGFGSTVALSGATALIGAYRAGPGSLETGAAYVFVRQGSLWVEQQKLTSAQVAGSAQFGYSVGLEGDRAAVGARAASSVFAFERSGSTWSETQWLRPLDGVGTGDFGRGVAVDGGRLLSARALENGYTEPGTGYAFRRLGDRWVEAGRLAPSDGTTTQLFGGALALSGRTAVVAAMWDDEAAADAGAVYLFDAPVGAGRTYCLGSGAGACPCGNPGTAGSFEGCANSTGRGGLLAGGGTAGVLADDLYFGAYNLPPFQTALLIASPEPTTTSALFGGGLLCLGGQLRRLGSAPVTALGTAAFGPGLQDLGHWSTGEAWGFQVIGRDPTEPCGTAASVTNGARVQFVP